jgi:hypothetical protein
MYAPYETMPAMRSPPLQRSPLAQQVGGGPGQSSVHRYLGWQDLSNALQGHYERYQINTTMSFLRVS